VIVEVTDGRIDLVRREVVSDQDALSLREKEVALLRKLLELPGQVVPRQVLEVEVFGYGASTATRTVDTTVRRLRKALAVVGADAAIQTVYGEGYRWCGPPPGRRSRVGIRGRQRLLEQAVGWLEGNGPLLVISGPGGMGKTLMAREVALRAASSTWVDLADVVEVDAAVDRIAEVLGAPRDAIGPHLALDGTLLVLDDCDALDPSMGTVVAEWLQAGARLVVTRRVALPWPGATTLRLEGLSLAATRELWATAHGDGEAAPEVWDHTAGHPLSILLLSRLARELDVRPVLQSRSLEQQLVDPDQLNPRHRSLGSLFASSLGDLPASARTLLGLLCVPRDEVPQAWLRWLEDHGLEAAEGLAALRDAGLVSVRDGAVRIHRMFRSLALAGVSPSDREEHAGLWVRWIGQRARAWLEDRRACPSMDELQQAFDLALEHGFPAESGPVLYLLARRTKLLARPQEAQRRRLQRLVERGGGRPWCALTQALLGLSEHPVQPDLGTLAIAAAEQTPWLGQARLLRAALRARVGDAAGATEDVEMAEREAGGRGERVVALTWLETAEILLYVDVDAARRRIEWCEGLLHLLDLDDRLQWHRTAAVVYGQLLAVRRHLEVTTSAASMVAPMEFAKRAAALAQLGSARWNVGDLTGALEAVEAAMELSRAARPWIRVMCCNNLCALRQQQLDAAGMRAAMALGVARAGSDPRARELARRLSSATQRYLGEAPAGISPDAMAAQLGTTDTGWFLWRAQCGDGAAAVPTAEALLLPLDRAPLRSVRARRLLELATLYLSVGRFRDALQVLDNVLEVLPMQAPNRGPAEVAREVAALRCQERQRLRLRRDAPAPSPLLQLETDLWWCVLDRDEARVAQLRREHAPPPGGELAWRFRFAAALVRDGQGT
jgi:tetratricopeptide (TPR) repeat protein